MKKGLVLPIAGIIMFVISVVAVYVLAQQDGNFTKEVIFKGEVAASNLNELEMIRKMLPMTMESMGQRAALDSAKSGCGKDTWTSTTPTINEMKLNLANKINAMPKTIVGNYNREISWSTLSTTDITIDPAADPTYFVIGPVGFTLEDDIIKSTATSSISATTVSTSYFTLYNIGQHLFTDAEYQAIIVKNVHETTRANNLKNSMFADCHLHGVSCDVQAINPTTLSITITDSNSLAPCDPYTESIGCTNSMKPLILTFKITIIEFVPVPDKICPVPLVIGWNYAVKTPYTYSIAANNAGLCQYVDDIEGPDPTSTSGWGDFYNTNKLLDPNTFYNIHTAGDCDWTGDLCT